jgi:hypothetical protein
MADQRDTVQSATIAQGSSTEVYAGGSVAHGSSDSGNPVKVGGKAASSLPTAVSSGQRANCITDLFGRQIVADQIDPAMQIWKSANYTSTQTGAAIWTPASGKKIAITYIAIGSYGTTAARLILWFGAGGGSPDTTYTAGTDQLVFAASFAPSANSKPGAIITPPVPIFCATADYVLRITTDAGMSVDVTVYGYEF